MTTTTSSATSEAAAIFNPPFFIRKHFAEAKVSQFDMSSVVNKDIVRFKVTVNDMVPVQEFQGANDLTNVKTGSVVVKKTVNRKSVKDFTTSCEIHNIK